MKLRLLSMAGFVALTSAFLIVGCGDDDSVTPSTGGSTSGGKSGSGGKAGGSGKGGTEETGGTGTGGEPAEEGGTAGASAGSGGKAPTAGKGGSGGSTAGSGGSTAGSGGSTAGSGGSTAGSGGTAGVSGGPQGGVGAAAGYAGVGGSTAGAGGSTAGAGGSTAGAGGSTAGAGGSTAGAGGSTAGAGGSMAGAGGSGGSTAGSGGSGGSVGGSGGSGGGTACGGCVVLSAPLSTSTTQLATRIVFASAVNLSGATVTIRMCVVAGDAKSNFQSYVQDTANNAIYYSDPPTSNIYKSLNTINNCSAGMQDVSYPMGTVSGNTFDPTISKVIALIVQTQGGSAAPYVDSTVRIDSVTITGATNPGPYLFTTSLDPLVAYAGPAPGWIP